MCCLSISSAQSLLTSGSQKFGMDPEFRYGNPCFSPHLSASIIQAKLHKSVAEISHRRTFHSDGVDIDIIFNKRKLGNFQFFFFSFLSESVVYVHLFSFSVLRRRMKISWQWRERKKNKNSTAFFVVVLFFELISFECLFSRRKRKAVMLSQKSVKDLWISLSVCIERKETSHVMLHIGLWL